MPRSDRTRDTVDLQRRSSGSASPAVFYGGVGGLGATAALLIGGVLTDVFGWQAVFVLNLPVAAAMLAVAPVLLEESRDRRSQRALDPAGAVSITVALSLLIYAIVEAPERGWGSPLTAESLRVACAAGVERPVGGDPVDRDQVPSMIT